MWFLDFEICINYVNYRQLSMNCIRLQNNFIKLLKICVEFNMDWYEEIGYLQGFNFDCVWQVIEVECLFFMNRMCVIEI